MPKKITMTAKPPAASADDWVTGTAAREAVAQAGAVTQEIAPDNPTPPTDALEAVPVKRLTIDIPAELHARIKSQCALRRSKMADEIRKLLENSFPESA